jgi:acetylornithine/N-succinyldiaminopimelate aminotransferase
MKTAANSVNQAHLDVVASIGKPDHCPMMPTFGAPTTTFVKGKGTELWDADGKRYLDFLCGLAVTGLGHGNDEIADAISEQARTLVHVSNLFATDVGPRVAMQLDALLGGGGQIFFANSGAEANECAIKVARKWGGHGKFQVISAFGSFHGRTLATLHMTGQPAKHEAFQPLPDGFKHAAWGDAADVERMIDPSVVAVMVEPVQGEGGVIPAPLGFLRDLRKLCTERGLLLMIDEIQTGLGRTGKWWGFEHHLHADERPDVITIAKQLGNGMPIGACWAKREIAAAFKPGDHGSTYSGQPLAASAALKVLEIMEREDIPAKAAAAGAYLSAQLRSVAGVAEVRGDGLLLAVELTAKNSKDVHAELMRHGIVTNNVTPTALRIAPPLNVSNEHIDEAVRALASAIAMVTVASEGQSS